MSKENEFEELFRTLNNVSSEVPEDTWQKICYKMDRKKRFVIAAFTFAFMLLIFSGISLLKNSSSKGIPKSSLKKEKSIKIDSQKIISGATAVTLKNRQSNIQPLTNSSKQTSLSIHSKIYPQSKNAKPRSNTDLMNNYSLKNNQDHQLHLQNEQGNKIIDSLINNTNAKNSIKKDAVKVFPSNNMNDEMKDNADDVSKNFDRISLSVFASPDLPFIRTIYADSTGLLTNNKNSMVHASFTFGARFQYSINKHFIAGLGVQYSKVNDKIKSENNTSATRYKTVDFPLLIGYSLSNNNFNAGINAGIILNINASHTNNISNTTPYPFYLQTDDAYKKNTGISYYAGINFSSNQFKNINLFAEPYFKYRPSNIVNTFQGFQQKINTAGILVGIKYNFSKKDDND